MLPPPTGEQKFHLDLNGAAGPALQLAADLLAHDVPDLGRECRERLPGRPLAFLDGREVGVEGGEGKPPGLFEGLDLPAAANRERSRPASPREKYRAAVAALL